MKSVKNYTRRQAQKDLPTRAEHENKTHGGKVLIVAGSKGMEGAAILCATAAARAGAGYVYLSTEKKVLSPLKNPDFLDFSMKSQKELSQFSAIAVGPGLQQIQSTFNWIQIFMKRQIKNVVLDAHALNVLSNKRFRGALPSSWILTPHEGELSRLIGVSSEEIRKNREYYVRMAQERFQCVVVLKGHKTLIADSKQIKINTTGNPALAKAGTGDVLTGLIAAFLSQGLPSLEAAALGAYVHGLAANRWIANKNDLLSLMASDLVELLPSTLFSLRHS